MEHLSICVRFFDHKQKNIREEFLAIGEAISAAILEFLSKSHISVLNIRGQGYDGASNMGSDAHAVGVQACIKQVAPLATNVHCIVATILI